jgi:hypothetical protein
MNKSFLYVYILTSLCLFILIITCIIVVSVFSTACGMVTSSSDVAVIFGLLLLVVIPITIMVAAITVFKIMKKFMDTSKRGDV